METALLERVRRLSDAQVVGATIWGEARNSGLDGMAAVGAVIANRVHDRGRRYGFGWRDVCLKPYQFSCWMEAGGKANYERMMRIVGLMARGEAGLGAPMAEALALASGLIQAGRAMHYMTESLYLTAPPSWAMREGERIPASGHIGGHVFFDQVDG